MGILKRGMGALLTAALILVANTAVAADVVIPDEYAEASEKKMLLQKAIKVSNPVITSQAIALLYKGMALKNFDIQKWGVESGELNAWCNEAATEAIERAGQVDAKGQARITVKALEKRCSDVFEYTHNLSGACKLTGKKNKSWSCSLKSTMKIWKYSAKVTADGKITFGRDKKFGTKTVSNSGSGSASQKAGKEAAMRSAASSLGKWVRRKLLDIKEFQIHAPIAAVKDGSSYICLGDDMVDLDLPFRVVMPTTKGEKEVGLIKAREIYDGCVLTTKLKKKKGKKAVIKPMRAQNIIGSSDIKPGHTAWELPQIGLASGLGAGIMPSTKASDSNIEQGVADVMGVQLNIEQSLARNVGISELHTFIKARAGVVADGAALEEQFALAYAGPNGAPGDGIVGLNGFNTPGTGTLDGTLNLQLELGLMKRFFFGRTFFELGGAAAGTMYMLESEDATYLGETVSVNYSIIGIGFAGQAGLGFQASNRLQIKLVGGYRMVATTPNISVTDSQGEVVEVPGLPDADPAGIGAEAGPMASLDFTWLI